MTVDPVALARMFLISLLCGSLLELLWEFFGFFICVLKYRKSGDIGPIKDSIPGLIIIFIKDILFFSVAGAVVAVLIYWTNDGQFRFLALAGLLIGFLCCYKTLGKLIRFLNLQLVKFLFTVLSLLTYPIRKLISLINALTSRTINYIRQSRMRQFTLLEIKKVEIIKANGMPE